MEWTRLLKGSRFRLPQPMLVTIMEEAMSRTIIARFLAMIGLAATMAGPRAWAQEAPLVRVRGTIERVDGRTLTLKYKDGEKKIFVPADTPIVIYEAGDKTDLNPGAKVFIVAA